MNGIGAIKASLESTGSLLKMYLDGFTDADMFVRPVPAANHAAWQVGQVIVGDKMLIEEQLPDAKFPELPPGSVELYGKEGAKKDGPDGFLTKDAYVSLFDATRSAVVAALEGLTDADLDRPTKGNMASFAPTLGDVFLLVANHTLMHGGQLTVIRRLLGKPVIF